MATTRRKITVGIDFDVNTQKLNELKKQFADIQKMSIPDINVAQDGTGKVNDMQTRLAELKDSAKQLETVFDKAFDFKTGTYNLGILNKELNKLDIGKISDDMQELGAAGQNAFLDAANAAMKMEKQVSISNKVINDMFKNFKKTIGWTISSSIINNLSGSVQKAYGYSKKLDKSLNNIRIVTKQSNEQMREFAKYASQSAAKLAKSTTDYTDAALIYYQQGLADKDVKARTDTTLKTANVTGQSASAVSQQLTAVWNGYKVSANEAEKYVDKLAAVAATTAADLEELSTGMSKVASAAATTGVDIDQLSAQMSTIISVTRQAPESVGTALKTIYARLGDLDISGNLGDVSGKLKTIGVDVLDSSGELRDMGDIIEEVAGKWDTMTAAQKNGVAIAMAGKRQYNNLFALFENWDMYKDAKETSENSLGELQTQQDIYLDSLESKLEQLSQAGENVVDSLFNADDIKPVVETLTTITNGVAKFIDVIGGGKGVLQSFSGILLSIFSKNIGSEIGRISNNISGFFTNKLGTLSAAANRQKFIDLGVNNKQASELGEDYARFTANFDYMTDEDKQTYSENIDKKVSNMKARNAVMQQAKSDFSSAFGDANDTVSGLFQEGDNFINEDMRNNAIEAEIDLLKDAEKEGDNLTDKIVHLLELTHKDGLFDSDKLRQDKEEIEELQKAIDETEKEISELKSQPQKTEEDIKEKEEELEARKKEMKGKTDKYLDDVGKEMKKKAEGYGELIEEVDEANKNIDKSLKARDISAGISEIAAGLTSIGGCAMTAYMGVKQLATAFDENSTGAEKMMAAFSGLTMIGGSIVPAIESITQLKNGLLLLKPALQSVKLATEAEGLAAFGPLALAIAGVAVAIGVCIKAYSDYHKAVNKYKEDAKEANEIARDTQTVLNNLKTGYEELKSSIDNLDSAEDALSKCKRGTLEWSEAMVELNNQVADLITKYPELQEYLYTDADGAMHISQEGLNKQLEIQLDAIQKQQMIATASANNARVKNSQANIETLGKNNSFDNVSSANTAADVGIGVLGGAATGAAAGALIGTIVPVIGNVVGAVIGGVVGGIAGGVTGAIENAEETDLQSIDALNRVADAVKTYGDSIYFNNDRLKEVTGLTQDQINAIKKNTDALKLIHKKNTDEENEKAYIINQIENNYKQQGDTDLTAQQLNMEYLQQQSIYEKRKKEYNEYKSNKDEDKIDEIVEKYITDILNADTSSYHVDTDIKKGVVTLTDGNGPRDYKLDNIINSLALSDSISETVEDGIQDFAKGISIDYEDLVNGEYGLEKETKTFKLDQLEAQSLLQGKASQATLNKFASLPEEILNKVYDELQIDEDTYVALAQDSIAFNEQNRNKTFKDRMEEVPEFNKEMPFYDQIDKKGSNLSLYQQNSIVELLKNSYQDLGREGLDTFNSMLSDEEISLEKLAQAYENAGHDLSNSEWLDKFKNSLREQGVSEETLIGYTEELNKIYKEQGKLLKDGLITSYEDLSKTINIVGNGFQLGQVISDANYDTLVKYNDELSKYFTLTASGDRVFIGDSNQFNEEIKNIKSANDLTKQYKNKRAIGAKLTTDNFNEDYDKANKGTNLEEDYSYLADNLLKNYTDDELGAMGIQKEALRYNLEGLKEPEGSTRYEESFNNLKEQLEQVSQLQKEYTSGTYNLGKALEIVANDTDDLSSLTGKLFNKETSAAKAKKAFNNVLSKEATALGLTGKQIQNYGKLLNKNNKELKLNYQLQNKVAMGSARYTIKTRELNTLFKENKKILEKGNEESLEYANILTSITESVQGWFNNQSIGIGFVKDHLDLIKKAAEGDTQALAELRKELANKEWNKIKLKIDDKAIRKKMDTQLKSIFDDIQEEIDKHPNDITFNIDDKNITKKLNKILTNAGEQAGEISKIIEDTYNISLKTITKHHWVGERLDEPDKDRIKKNIGTEYLNSMAAEHGVSLERQKNIIINDIVKDIADGVIDSSRNMDILRQSGYSNNIETITKVKKLTKNKDEEGGDDEESKKDKSRKGNTPAAVKGTGDTINKLQKIKFDAEKDVLLEINKLIEEQGKLLSNLNDETERLYGSDSITNQMNEIKALKEENDLLDKRIEKQKEQQKIDEKKLRNKMVTSGIGKRQANKDIDELTVTDAHGNVVGFDMDKYDELTQENRKRFKKAKKAVLAQRKMSADIKDLNVAQDSYNKNKKLLEEAKKRDNTKKVKQAIAEAPAKIKANKDDVVNSLSRISKLSGADIGKKVLKDTVNEIQKEYNKIKKKDGDKSAQKYLEKAYKQAIIKAAGGGKEGKNFYKSMQADTIKNAQDAMKDYQSKIESRAQDIYEDYTKKIENLNTIYDKTLSLVRKEYELRKQSIENEKEYYELREAIKDSYLSESGTVSDKLGIYNEEQKLNKQAMDVDAGQITKEFSLLQGSIDNYAAAMQEWTNASTSIGENSSSNAELASAIADIKEKNAWNQADLAESVRDSISSLRDNAKEYFSKMKENFENYFSLQETYLQNLQTIASTQANIGSAYERQSSLLELLYGKRRSVSSTLDSNGASYTYKDILDKRMKNLYTERDILLEQYNFLDGTIKNTREYLISQVNKAKEKINSLNNINNSTDKYNLNVAKESLITLENNIGIYKSNIASNEELKKQIEDAEYDDDKNIVFQNWKDRIATAFTERLQNSNFKAAEEQDKLLTIFNNSSSIKDFLKNSGYNVSGLKGAYQELQSLMKDSFKDVQKQLSTEIDTTIANYNNEIEKAKEKQEEYLAIGKEAYKNLFAYATDMDFESITAEQLMNMNVDDVVTQSTDSIEGIKKELQEFIDSAASGTTSFQQKIMEQEQQQSELSNKIGENTEELVQLQKELINEKLKGIQETINVALTGTVFGIEDLKDSWEQWQSHQNVWVDEVNRSYEIDKLNRAVDKEYNSLNGNIKAQEKLKTVMSEQLDILKEKDKMSQYDLDRANAIFNLTKAQIALEEARNNKSKLKLRRDSSGNYSYQYVADLDDIADKEQAVKDAEINSWNLDKNELNTNISSIISSYSGLSTTISDIYEKYGGADGELLEEQILKTFSNWTDSNGNLFNKMLTSLENVFDVYDLGGGYSIQDILNAFDTTSDINDDLRSEIVNKWSMTGGLAEAGYSTAVMGTIAPILNKYFAFDKAGLNQGFFDTNGKIADKESAQNFLNSILGALGISGADNLQDAVKQISEELSTLSTKFNGMEMTDTDRIVKASEAVTESLTTLNTTIKETIDSLIKTDFVDQLMQGTAYSALADSVSKLVEKLDIDTIDTLKVKTTNLIISEDISSNAVGGELSNWGSEGKIGILHQNEVVVNSDLVQKIRDFFANNTEHNTMWALDRNTQLDSMLQSVAESNKTTLDQNVNIKAEFPNVKEHTEIEQALNNLVNRASQYALKPSLV